MYQTVTTPIPALDAFVSTEPDAPHSQAAFLLLLGAQMRGDAAAASARAAAFTRKVKVEAIPQEDLDVFKVPQLQPAKKSFALQSVRGGLRKRFGVRLTAELEGKKEPRKLFEALPDLVRRVHRTRDWGDAAQLFEAALAHPHDLVSVAAAASYHAQSANPGRSLQVLRKGVRSSVELVRGVAATALARFAPEDPALAKLLAARRRPQRARKSHTLALVHGTWARSSDWWQPGGDFFEYLKGGPRPDVYGAADRYSWSGGYSDGARSLAADDLVSWVSGHQLGGLDIIAHSHGANVAMLATQRGMRAGKLVLLSCPVHVQKYMLNFANVNNRVVSVRVRLDLVILADRGGQRFPNGSGVTEIVLPIWFDHFATHNPDVWRANNLPARIPV